MARVPPLALFIHVSSIRRAFQILALRLSSVTDAGLRSSATWDSSPSFSGMDLGVPPFEDTHAIWPELRFMYGFNAVLPLIRVPTNAPSSVYETRLDWKPGFTPLDSSALV